MKMCLKKIKLLYIDKNIAFVFFQCNFPKNRPGSFLQKGSDQCLFRQRHTSGTLSVQSNLDPKTSRTLEKSGTST